MAFYGTVPLFKDPDSPVEVNIYGYNISTLMGPNPIDQTKAYRAPNHLDFTHNRTQ